MNKIRITKLSGDGLIPVHSTKGNRKEKFLEGNSGGELFPEVPTVGRTFGVYDETFAFRTTIVTEVLPDNIFKTENSTYKWERII